MTAPSRRPPAPSSPAGGSPAVVVTVAAGLVGLLLSLNRGGFAIALFLAAVSLAALPLALADKPGARAVRLALLGGGMAALALALVLGPLLFGDAERAERGRSPARARTDVPSTPAPAASQAPAAPGG